MGAVPRRAHGLLPQPSRPARPRAGRPCRRARLHARSSGPPDRGVSNRSFDLAQQLARGPVGLSPSRPPFLAHRSPPGLGRRPQGQAHPDIKPLAGRAPAVPRRSRSGSIPHCSLGPTTGYERRSAVASGPTAGLPGRLPPWLLSFSARPYPAAGALAHRSAGARRGDAPQRCLSISTTFPVLASILTTDSRLVLPSCRPGTERFTYQ
jgi:hypothetical protein